MIPLTTEQLESHEKIKNLLYMQKRLECKYMKDKNYRGVKNRCHYTVKYKGSTYSICNLKYILPKKTHVVFYHGSSYDYPVIIKGWASKRT